MGGRAAQIGAVIATGLLMTLAFPLQFWSLEVPSAWQGYTAWIAFAPLILVAEGRAPARVALLFWGAAWIYFTGTIFWVVVAMTEYGHVPFAASLLALFLLSAILSLFHAAAGYMASRIQHRWSLSLVWPAALAMTSLEYLRNYVFTGFPWSNPAYSQARFLTLIQIADVTGIYGITFLIVLTGGALAGVLAGLRAHVRGAWHHLAIAGALLSAVWLYGSWRIPQVLEAEVHGKPLRVGLLQGNIPQDEKWLESEAGRILTIYAEQVHLAQAKGAELIVWPEASIPDLLSADLTQMIPEAFPPEGPRVPQVIGAPVYEPPENAEDPLVLHNSAFVVDGTGRVMARYDKSHLVPFGEYVPLRAIFRFLGPLVQAVGEFVPGTEVRPVSDGRHQYGVLVCYEDIFPEISRKMGQRGMELLINVTNDAWYGPTSALDQHLDMAVFRAIESRVPVARAANTGISAFINATGRVIEQTRPWVPAVVVQELKLTRARSPYLVLGDGFAVACLGITAFLTFLRPRQRRGQSMSPVAG